MGKAKIISGGTDGRYQIQILAYKSKAEARIDALQDKIEQMQSGEDAVFSPSLYDQYVTLLDKIDQYRDAIEDNRNKEEQDAELTNDIALQEQKLKTLQDELSDLESIRDTKQDEYEDAQDQFDNGEITQAELDWWEARYLAAQSDYVAKLANVSSQETVVNNLKAEKTAIEFADLAKELEEIKKKAGTFLDYDAKEPISQLEDHLDYAETVLRHMAQAFNAAINWYNDAVTQNYQDQMDAADWTEQQYPISQQVSDASTELSAAKSTRDSKQSDYDAQYVKYLRGEISEAELEPYADALSLAHANYTAKLATYNHYYSQWEDLEIQINGCVVIKTEPMKDRMDATAIAYEQMSHDVGSLRAFLDVQELKVIALEKEIERLQAAIDRAERTQEAWCADLTEDLAADTEVGTIEINGEADTIIIHPGYDGAAVYDQDRDGQLQPPELSTAAQAFYNYAMLPGWQKWKPTYRVGTITALDGDTCTVALDAALSNAQSLDINQAETLTDVPIEYMTCDGAAFEEGDRVVVKFEEGDWEQPKVIGFESEPQPCGGLLHIVLSYTYASEQLHLIWDIDKNEAVEIDGISLPAQMGTILEDYLDNHPLDDNQSALYDGSYQENHWPSTAFVEGETVYDTQATFIPDRDGDPIADDTYEATDSDQHRDYTRKVNAHPGRKLICLNNDDLPDTCVKWSFTNMEWSSDFVYGEDPDITRTEVLDLTIQCESPLDKSSTISFLRTAISSYDYGNPEKYDSVTGNRLEHADPYYYTLETKTPALDSAFYNSLTYDAQYIPDALAQIFVFYYQASTITGVEPKEYIVQHDIVTTEHNLIIHAQAARANVAAIDPREAGRNLQLESAVEDMIAAYRDLLWPDQPESFPQPPHLSISLYFRH